MTKEFREHFDSRFNLLQWMLGTLVVINIAGFWTIIGKLL